MRRRLRTAAWLGATLAAFGVGIAIGQALGDHPRSGGAQTFVRTLSPLPLAPERETVTVTTASP